MSIYWVSSNIGTFSEGSLELLTTGLIYKDVFWFWNDSRIYKQYIILIIKRDFNIIMSTNKKIVLIIFMLYWKVNCYDYSYYNISDNVIYIKIKSI